MNIFPETIAIWQFYQEKNASETNISVLLYLKGKPFVPVNLLSKNSQIDSIVP